VSPDLILRHVQARLTELVATACPTIDGPGLLVALSGGPDSVALLRLAHLWSLETGRPVAAAHFNHDLRGDDSDGDDDFCQALCHQLQIPLFRHRQDPRPVAERRGRGLEEAARHLRHTWFEDLLRQQDQLHCVATGHHRGDQAETVVMRLFRGSGPDGLAGIRPVSGQVIHPLLDLTRTDLLAFLESEGLAWRTDPTNFGPGNIRARVRRELLPLVRDLFGAGAERTPARLADLLANDLALLDDLTDKALADLAPAGAAGLPVAGLLALPPALGGRVLRRWLFTAVSADPRRVEEVHVANILDWLRVGQSGSGLDLPGGLRLERQFDTLVARTDPQAAYPLQAADGFRILVVSAEAPPDALAHGLAEGHGRPGDPGHWNLTCPANVLQGNLRVRNFRPGDRLQAFGLDGSRKLSDLLQERRVPAPERGAVLVVEDDEGILWAVGLARAERTRLLPSAERFVTISVVPRARS